MKNQVIFIMTDTTRCDMLGCYGNDKMITPNIDKLAQNGIRYTNAYSCQPVCGPARSAIFTGLFPHSNGVVANSIAMGDNVKTIGQRLHDNNVLCGYIGKWHLDGSDYFGNGICPEGFKSKYWYDMRTYLNELTDEEKLISRKSNTAENMKSEFSYGHRCSDRAINFINEYKDQDFFLTVSYDEPHGPSLCPYPYNTMYDGVKMPDSENYTDTLENKPLMQKLWAGNNLNKSYDELHESTKKLSLFLGCNSFVDMQIGRVLDNIYDKCPEALIIFTSDHGDMLNNHRLTAKNATVYKEVSNVPFIVYGGNTGVCDKPTSHIDITPTILDYFDIEIPVILEGTSILKQFNDPYIEINETVFIEFTRYEVDHDGFGGLQMMRAVTDGRYKLSINLLDTDELYDMKTDTFEMKNLINCEEYSDIRNKLHDDILLHMDKTRDVYRGYQWACRPWRADKIETFSNGGFTRQRLNEEYEPRQLDYNTGLPIKDAIRKKK